MSLGESLRLAREEKGQTISQVADATRMMVQIVEDLEREDFRRIAAPIYGRGFIKLYAEHLSLDPEPLVREFMEIYTGSRPPQVSRRSTETVAESAPSIPDPAPRPAIPEPATVEVRPVQLAPAEPDLFTLAADRSQAVRTVPDPAQPVQPPRARPPASRPEAHLSAPAEPAPRRLAVGAQHAAETSISLPDLAAVRNWLVQHQLHLLAAVGAVIVCLLIVVVARRHKTHPDTAPRATAAPVRVQRVLPPEKPYFE